MFARKRSGREFATNFKPQPMIDGSTLGRSRKGASSLPIHFTRCQNTPGEFHGSAMLGVSMPALAWLVPCAGSDARSITVTSQPSRARNHAVATPSKPDPTTTTFISSPKCRRERLDMTVFVAHRVLAIRQVAGCGVEVDE